MATEQTTPPRSRLAEVYDAAKELSDNERRELLFLIEESLPESEDSIRYDAADIAEWNRRIEDYRAGRVEAIPAEEVFEKIRKRLER